MLKKRIIPCLDCKNGRTVKGVQFQNLVDAGSPSELAQRYEADGADEIILLDIAASVEERKNQLATVKAVRSVLSIPLTVGGGVRTVVDIEELLKAGADRVSLNTAAVRNPSIVNESATLFGTQCVVVAIDARKKGDDWVVVTRSGTIEERISVNDWATEVKDRGAGEIMLTSFDRDGTRSGYDLELLESVTKRVSIPVIASGGARNAEDLADAFEAGAAAVLAASIFHFGEYTVREIKNELKEKGVAIRV